MRKNVIVTKINCLKKWKYVKLANWKLESTRANLGKLSTLRDNSNRRTVEGRITGFSCFERSKGEICIWFNRLVVLYDWKFFNQKRNISLFCLRSCDYALNTPTKIHLFKLIYPLFLFNLLHCLHFISIWLLDFYLAEAWTEYWIFMI